MRRQQWAGLHPELLDSADAGFILYGLREELDAHAETLHVLIDALERRSLDG